MFGSTIFLYLYESYVPLPIRETLLNVFSTLLSIIVHSQRWSPIAKSMASM